jgi:hypothetical protein
VGNERFYTSKRASILVSLAEALKQINGTESFWSNLENNVHPRLLFWDEVSEYPAIHLAVGRETRQYQGGGYKDRFLTVTVRCYVKDEDSALSLEKLLEDIETVVEQNGRLAYQDASGASHTTHDITITSIETDEGVLSPLGVGEILLQIRY